MKKRLIIILVAAVFVLLIGIACLNFFPMLGMNPTESGQIKNTNIYAVKNSINTVFFIKSGDAYIMIDAGSNKKSLKLI